MTFVETFNDGRDIERQHPMDTMHAAALLDVEEEDVRADFILEPPVLDVQGLDLLPQHPPNVPLLTLCHHSPGHVNEQ